jgi:hypothetical protein
VPEMKNSTRSHSLHTAFCQQGLPTTSPSSNWHTPAHQESRVCKGLCLTTQTGWDNHSQTPTPFILGTQLVPSVNYGLPGTLCLERALCTSPLYTFYTFWDRCWRLMAAGQRWVDHQVHCEPMHTLWSS